MSESESGARTSIGLGNGEVIVVRGSLDEVRREWQDCFGAGHMGRITFMECVALTGETILVNPRQVKVLQDV